MGQINLMALRKYASNTHLQSAPHCSKLVRSLDAMFYNIKALFTISKWIQLQINSANLTLIVVPFRKRASVTEDFDLKRLEQFNEFRKIMRKR